MNNEVALFESEVPAHAKNPQSKTMQAMAGGITGGGFGNRISLKNSKFRFIKAGTDLGPIAEPTLDVVIFALSDSVQRRYYAGAFDANSKDKPTCYSMDGKVPMADSTEVQSPTCATCPQNVKGSGRMAGTKACAYIKRVIVVSAYDLTGEAYALDVNGMSMFGEQIDARNLYSFKGYFEKLSLRGADVAALVTRLSFDDSASVPKLHFSPVRFLHEDEYAKVQKRAENEDVALMLRDMTNIMENNDVEFTGSGTTPADPEQISGGAPPVTAKPRMAAVASKPAHGGVGGLQSSKPRGFPTAPSKIVEEKAATTTKAVKSGIEIDLSKLVDFDDK